jgi:hypothetical protein
MKQSYKKGLMLSALLSLFSFSVNATEPIDSVDVYQNQTVNSVVVVQGRSLLSVNNVSVTNTGKLKLSAPAGVSVTGPLTVVLGGEFEMNGGMQYAIRYTYDASGNRIRREKVTSD